MDPGGLDIALAPCPSAAAPLAAAAPHHRRLDPGPRAAVPPDAPYYTLGHLSRFVQPGAVRIASTSFGTTGWNGEVMDVAFRDPDGTTVLVAHNENDNPQAFGVREGDQGFTYTLPGDSLATFTWKG